MATGFSSKTLILYVFVVLASTFFAFLSGRRSYADNSKHGETDISINLFWFFLSFVTCWGLIGFSICGIDYPVYQDIFLDSTNLFNVLKKYDIEVGYAIINYIVRIITSNPHVFFSLCAFIFVFFVYLSIYKMRAFIHPAWGVFVFTTVFFFQAMNLRRIYMAAAIILFATTFLIEKKYGRYCILLFVSIMIHTSAVIMILPLIYDLYKCDKIPKIGLLIIASVMLIAVYVFRKSIFAIVISKRYSNYGVQDGGIGLVQLLYHIPLMYCLLVHISFSEIESRYNSIGFFYLLMSFVIGMTGYFVSVIGRAFVYFMFPFLLAPSYTSSVYVCNDDINLSDLTPAKMSQRFFAIYFLLRLGLYFYEYLLLDGIMPYRDIFGNVL